MILNSRKMYDERILNWEKNIQIKIQKYIKNGCLGDLNFSGTPITFLPNNLTKVGGNLDLHDTYITKLPDKLKQIDGCLDLDFSTIEDLPNNLTVKSLRLFDCQFIKILPENLTVFLDMSISYTKISVLPSTLKLGGNLMCSDTEFSVKYDYYKELYPNIDFIFNDQNFKNETFYTQEL